MKTLSESHRRGYVERLRDILTNGFWMTRPKEHLVGWGQPVYMTSIIDMTCFTEVRLSHAEQHSQRYGLLGIGVERKFVLDRRGGPVHYVRNSVCESVVGNSLGVFLHCQAAGAHKQEELIRRNIGYLKPMSNPNSDDFAYLDEHEWRITHTHEAEKEGLIVSTGSQDPVYRIPVQPGDVRLIVSRTRRLDIWHTEMQPFRHSLGDGKKSIQSG
jgi:hypothetical protein